MPKSMTGYGRGECIRYDRRLKVEIKAVNHRYNDIVIKMPRFLNPLEDKIRRRLAQDIVRGKVDVWINFESFAQKDVTVNVDRNLADAYIEALSGLSARYDFGPLQVTPALELIARNPDIIMMNRFDTALDSDTDQEEIWEALGGALENALEEFNAMRIIEGEATAMDIGEKRIFARDLVAKIAKLAPEVIKAQGERYKERLDDIIEKMGKKPDDTRLMTEIAIMADKGCISEEISRLQSHLAQLAAMLQEDDAIGRKLDFLVQELNREANTIGSKSGDVSVTALVVELKSVIEKMREQAQNIE